MYQAITEEVVKKCEELSAYITAHLHSDALTSTKPTPELLLKEIQDFDAIRKRHKELTQSCSCINHQDENCDITS